MEIKRSTDVARPVEVAKRAPKWPWIVGLSIGGAVVLALGVVGYVMYSQRVQPPTPTINDAANDQPAPEAGKVREVNPTPNPEDLTKIVFGLYDEALAQDQIFTGPVTIYALDLSSSRPKSNQITVLERAEASTTVIGAASPNGQFLALFEPAGSRKNDQELNHVWLVDLVSGQAQEIVENPSLVGQFVWSSDSKTLFWGERDADATTLVAFYVASGETKRYARAIEQKKELALIPQALREGELFVVLQDLESEDPGTLGVIKLGEDGNLEGEFEKLLDLSANQRGLDISPDGRLIVMARGSSSDGPYLLELMDRGNGDIEELRRSPTEQYQSPLFTLDGERIVYAAASGLWAYTLADSGDRVQLVANTEIDNLLTQADLKPWVMQPDGSRLVFVASNDEESQILAIDLDAEEASSDDLTVVAEDTLAQSVFGWTK